MNRSRRIWPATAVLLAAVALATVGQNARSQAAQAARPANGVYAVLAEGSTRAEVEVGKRPRVVLVYDGKYTDAGKRQQPRYVAVDPSSFVPLILAAPPASQIDERGWTSLSVTLAPQHVKSLENLTRTHLGGTVAIVLDGEIITTHKVRTVIVDGKARITRCSDDACKSLLLKLAQ